MSAVAEAVPPSPSETSGLASRSRRWVDAAAGPVLIVVCVVIAMRGFLFHPLLTNQHADILSFILPRFCYLGQRLAAGEIPLWNPWLQAGTPYAADPQSGWMYLPPMALFTTMSCGAAMRAFIVMQPLLAGLSLYGFLRMERLRRTAATMGGLAFAMAIAGSAVAVSMPFAGTLAWTPLVLVGASGFMRARSWTRSLLWMGLGALAWGQVAGAHMSHGLFMATLVALTYLVARAAHEVRIGVFTRWAAVGRVALFMAFLPLANLAFLLPRLALVGRSALSQGYAALGPTASASLGVTDQPLADGGIWAAWPLALGSTPGAYVGAAVLLTLPLAWRSSRRWLFWALASAGVVTYAMTLDFFVGARWFRELVLRIPFGDVYIHNPSRFRQLALLLVPALAALAIDGLIREPPPRRTLLRWLAASAAVFLVAPLLFGAYPKRLAILALGMAIIVWPLIALARGQRWAYIALPVVLAVEMLGAALYGNAYEGGGVYLGLERRGPWLDAELTLPPGPLRYPDVSISAYEAGGPITDALATRSADRFLAWAPPLAFTLKGYLFEQQPEDWPAMFNGRGMLFGAPDAMGYNPFQLARYWRFVRATNDLPIYYNAAVIQEPSLEDLRLLGVRTLTIPKGVDPPVGAHVIAEDGTWQLVQIDDAQTRASLPTSWVVEQGLEGALEQVTMSGFDPARVAVLETDPGLERVDGAQPGTATYAETSPELVTVVTNADAPGIAVIRNAYDENWSATVDGKPATVLPVDGFLQGVPVEAGKHLVALTYREPWIGRGLAGAGVVWGAWLVAVIATALLRWRRRRGDVGRPGTRSRTAPPPRSAATDSPR